MWWVRTMLAVLCISFPIDANAAGECRVIDRITRIHNQLALITTGNIDQADPFVRASLRSDLAHIDDAILDTALASHKNLAAAASIKDVHMLAKAILNMEESNGDNLDARNLQNVDMRRIVRSAALGILEFQCDEPLTLIATVRVPENDRGTGNGSETSPSAQTDHRTKSLISHATLGLIAFLLILIGAIMSSIGRKILIQRRRRSKRYVVNFKTDLAMGENRQSVKVFDLSCHGAKIGFDDGDPPFEGTPSTLLIAGVDYPARVIWSNTHYIGLSFKKSVRRQIVLTCAGKSPTRNRTSKTQTAVPIPEPLQSSERT